MNFVNTLPFRSYISNFLCCSSYRKTLIFFLFVFLIQLTSGCSRSSNGEGIDVEIWHNGSPLDCNMFESTQQVWSIQALAFFMSNVRLFNEETEYQPTLSSTPWQNNDVVMIQPNLDNCAKKSEGKGNVVHDDPVDPEQLKTNNRLQFLTPVDLNSSTQFSFTLAVPFALNHQNPLLQPSPLNLPSMFWSWRSGHKFFRLDMQSPKNSWVFHLGSVGCSAASTMRSPKRECVQPNRVSFNLNKKYDGKKLVMHLDRLIANTSMQNNDSCLFHSGQENCSILMSNFKTQDVFEWH